MGKANFIGCFNNTHNISDLYNGDLGAYKVSGQLATDGSDEIALVEDNQLWFFGRLYGVQKLASQYGIEFEKNADFVLKLYLNQGIECAKLLDGEFTFILNEGGRITICRDRHGAGPQVFFSSEYFASNLFAFRDFSNFSLEPDHHAIATFMSLGYIPSPQSSLKGVQKLPAGNYLIVNDEKVTVHSQYNFQEFFNAMGTCKLSEQDAILEYERLHKEAVQTRIDGKKSVGLLMSGGYDSGGNIGALRDVYQGDVSTFSIGFKDNPWTELPLAKLLAHKFDAKHKDYEIDGTEIFDLPKIVDFVGDPFQEGGLMVNYMVMGLIGDQKPEVILGGDGNDQHHGTGGKELAIHYMLKSKGLHGLQKMLASMSGWSIFNNDNKFFRAKFHNEKILNILEGDVFGFSQSQLKNIFKSGIKVAPPNHYGEVPRSYNGFDQFYLIHNYFGDIKQVINEVILFKASKMAAMHDNKLTFPYMSTDLYNFLMTLPRDLKISGSVSDLAKGRGVTKYLHKRYLEPKLPREITHRKKQGGFAPLPIFFKNEAQRKVLTDFILNSAICKEVFKRDKIEAFINDYNAGLKKGSYWFWYSQVKATQLFNLLALAVWWEMMIIGKKGNSIQSLS